MKKGILGLVTVLVMLAGAVEAQLILPPAGEDSLPATEAELAVIITGQPRMDIGCSGPTRIKRGDPMDGMVPTEIVAMQLSCTGGIAVMQDPGRPSTGQIRANGESFFNVFVQINVPGVGTLTNEEPAIVQSTIGHIPPLGSVYFGVRPVTLLLGGAPVGQLIHVKHRVNGVPKPETTGEFSQVMSGFYECKQGFEDNWLELTTLMLVNQSAKLSLLAEILFINGNQQPIARTRTELSPEDLDEINVCETLLQGGIVVPPAGVIEVVLLPVGGAYGWIKNLTGTFQIGQPEPFPFGTVTGVAKTEMRLVGPNVVRPEEIQAKPAPIVLPILIEGTDP